jgi:predicted RNA-binding Zn ribbon-like protein
MTSARGAAHGRWEAAEREARKAEAWLDAFDASVPAPAAEVERVRALRVQAEDLFRTFTVELSGESAA